METRIKELSSAEKQAQIRITDANLRLSKIRSDLDEKQPQLEDLERQLRDEKAALAGLQVSVARQKALLEDTKNQIKSIKPENAVLPKR